MSMQSKPRKHDHLIFYDSWVSRDIAGIPFANSRPFVLHQYSLARLQKGLPFPVSCCWNGMAVFNGTFFQQGYQFRCASLYLALPCLWYFKIAPSISNP